MPKIALRWYHLTVLLSLPTILRRLHIFLHFIKYILEAVENPGQPRAIDSFKFFNAACTAVYILNPQGTKVLSARNN